MKKILALFLLIALALSLMGCELYNEQIGNNVSMFVDPSSAADVNIIPDDITEADLTAEDESSEQQTEEATPAEPEQQPVAESPDNNTAVSITGQGEETVITTEIMDNLVIKHITNPELVDSYFYGDGFKFLVPADWQRTMRVDITCETIGEESKITYDFYFVPSENSEALMMRVIVVSSTYYYGTGVSGTTIAAKSSDLKTLFLLAKLTNKLPDDFPNPTEYIEIYQKLAESGALIATI